MTSTLVACTLLVLGCGGANILIGERADGLTVECEEKAGDDVYVCEPDDGDDVCEGWVDGGPAIVLWPPNHKMVAIDVEACLQAYDTCGDDPTDPAAEPPVWTIDRVTSDEPVDVGRGGDGHTDDFDVFLGGELSVEVRSERQGGGDGRVYQVHLLSDQAGAFACEIHVPHNRGPFGGAIDSGEAVSVSN